MGMMCLAGGLEYSLQAVLNAHAKACTPNSGSSLIRKYVYGPGMDNPVMMVRRLGSTDTRYYYYTDALGSVRLLTDAAGAVVESYTYDPYGYPRVMYTVGGVSGAGPDGNWLTEDVATYSNSFLTRGNPIMFTGRWWDNSTKLYYYRFRDYSPTLGRFLQPDPIGYADTMNLYAYCGNNPINFIDPWGLWSVGGHRRLGRYGNGTGQFDYARLDLEQSAWHTAYRWRHFRPLGASLHDARDAARRHDARDFELHMHEVQDYYSHTAAGYGRRLGHFWTYAPDRLDNPQRIGRYDAADRKTREMEDYWDKYNPPSGKKS